MFGFGKKKESGLPVIAPVAGPILAVEDVPDPLFSSGKMGVGFAVDPAGDTICAPVAGTLMLVAQTGHAFAIETANGAQVLVHIGVDTVALKGRGFEVLEDRAAGQQVGAGDPIIRIDRDLLGAEAPSSAVIVLVTNAAKGYDVSAPKTGVEPGEPVMSVRKA